MNMPTIENVCCRVKNLETFQAATEAALALLQAPNTESITGAGTAYSLTNTAAAVDLGTTDPAIVLGVAGTYLIIGIAKLEYTGATVAAETATIKLRRTNNTAADIGTPVLIDLPAATTLTHTYGQITMMALVTTANTDDAITIFGNVSAALGAGTIDVSAASIIAIKLG